MTSAGESCRLLLPSSTCRVYESMTLLSDCCIKGLTYAAARVDIDTSDNACAVVLLRQYALIFIQHMRFSIPKSRDWSHLIPGFRDSEKCPVSGIPGLESLNTTQRKVWHCVQQVRTGKVFPPTIIPKLPYNRFQWRWSDTSFQRVAPVLR
jgi:hypothetical protein